MKHPNKLVPTLFAAAVLALALAACGSSGDSTTDGGSTGASTPAGGGKGEAAAPTIVVRSGEPVGGIQELEYSAGDTVRFNVESDVADEIHVHGYDLMEDVPKGGEVSFDFPAEIEGIFEVELEGRKEQIAELRVNP
jgi:plastocyanin